MKAIATATLLRSLVLILVLLALGLLIWLRRAEGAPAAAATVMTYAAGNQAAQRDTAHPNPAHAFRAAGLAAGAAMAATSRAAGRASSSAPISIRR